jgi:hypothetical protein
VSRKFLRTLLDKGCYLAGRSFHLRPGSSKLVVSSCPKCVLPLQLVEEIEGVRDNTRAVYRKFLYFQCLEEIPHYVCGSRSLKTTMIYTHVLNRGGLGVQSPLDLLG